MQYFWLSLAILVTALNGWIFYRSRKNKRIAKQKYNETMGYLRDKTMKQMKKQGLHFDRTYPFVSDIDEGYLMCLDTENKAFSITDEDSVRIMDYSDVSSSWADINWEDDDQRFFSGITFFIKTKLEKDPIPLVLAHNRHKKTSLLGNYFLDTTEKLNAVIRKLKQETADASSTRNTSKGSTRNSSKGSKTAAQSD